MRLCTVDTRAGRPVVGVVIAHQVWALPDEVAAQLDPRQPMLDLIERWDAFSAPLHSWAASVAIVTDPSGQGGAPATLLGHADRSDGLHLLAPIPRPGKLLAIGLNYLDHVNERIIGETRTVPEHQLWFTKLGNAINGPFDPVVLPAVSDKTDYEGELVAVIGQRCKHVAAERAHEVVFGYCVGNDVSVRDWQKRTSQWMLGKSFDTHAPFGPWITTADELGDPHRLDLNCWVNGELRQTTNTRLMIHNVWDQIALLSQAMTLEPGDVIFTGTCSGVGAAFEPPKFLRAGDRVRVEIEHLGAIEASFVADDTAR